MALENRFKEAFAVCPVCGGELVDKRVVKLLRGGTDTATIEVDALVCQRCGERLYPEETVRLFERIRTKLRRGQTDSMTLVGNSYEATDN